MDPANAPPAPGFAPRVDRIYIAPVPEDVRQFVEKVWFAFVNKAVSLVFPNDQFVFEHSVFEAIEGGHLTIRVSSSQAAMKRLVQSNSPPEFKAFVRRARPIALEDERNRSAALIRQAIIDVAQGSAPPIDEIDLGEPAAIHPSLEMLLSPKMRIAMVIPLFVKGQPIGVLWGIRSRPFTRFQRRQALWKLRTLFEGISNIIGYELDGTRDDHLARRSIEKIYANSQTRAILHRTQGAGLPPVRSLYAYSYHHRREYRLDTSYLIPLSRGFGVSIKQYLPQDSNRIPVNLLMVPGMFCNRSAMDRLATEMALKYRYKVYSLDIRGRSKHTRPRKRRHRVWSVDDYICEDFPAALSWIRERHPEERTVVMGHSMGGMIPRFYTGSYRHIRQSLSIGGGWELPDPEECIAGIMGLASPSYIGLKASGPLVDLFTRSVNVVPGRMLHKALDRVLAQTLPRSFKSVDLNRFFNLISRIRSTGRGLSFNLGTRLPTLQDFIGYDEITPPEWYFLMEDVFCEESSKVVYQFVRSQLGDPGFWSFDGKINYTEDLRNVRLPVYSIVGNLDTLAPPESVQHGFDRLASPRKQMATFDQGHLGIIMHLKTVRKICSLAHQWIQTL